MKKYISLFIPALLLYSAAQAQQDINSVLKSIESRNKTLQAESRLHETRQLEAHTGNYLANPTVELNQLWADRSAGGMSMSWQSSRDSIFLRSTPTSINWQT